MKTLHESIMDDEEEVERRATNLGKAIEFDKLVSSLMEDKSILHPSRERYREKQECKLLSILHEYCPELKLLEFTYHRGATSTNVYGVSKHKTTYPAIDCGIHMCSIYRGDEKVFFTKRDADIVMFTTKLRNYIGKEAADAIVDKMTKLAETCGWIINVQPEYTSIQKLF